MPLGPDYHREYRRKNAEKIVVRERLRQLRRYNITPAEYEDMVRAQGGRCKICNGPETSLNRTGKPKMLCIDHDHSCCPERSQSCGECVRGLICNRCNTVLGRVGDSRSLLRKMVIYLEGEE